MAADTTTQQVRERMHGITMSTVEAPERALQAEDASASVIRKAADGAWLLAAEACQLEAEVANEVKVITGILNTSDSQSPLIAKQCLDEQPSTCTRLGLWMS